jgi:hypothetical protein
MVNSIGGRVQSPIGRRRQVVLDSVPAIGFVSPRRNEFLDGKLVLTPGRGFR